MKKKILSLVLALAMCLGLTISAFAAKTNTYTETYKGITTTYTDTSEGRKHDVTMDCTGTGVFTAQHLYRVMDIGLCYEGTLTINLGPGIVLEKSADFDEMLRSVESYGTTVKINYSGTGSSTQPQQPAEKVAYASTQKVTVDGKAVEFQMYALKDANGNGTNYIKLRDMAYVLNGTKAQFAVGYDGTISLTTGQAYAAAGGEMTTPFSGDRTYSDGTQSVKVNGKPVEMTAITLLDDAGGGYNYFKLRDLGKALGFNVGWSKEAGVIVETDKPYAE